MKFSFTVLVSAILAAQTIALPTLNDERADANVSSIPQLSASPLRPPRCPRARDSIRLYRAWNPSNTDHFYTTNGPEWNNAANTLGYTREGVASKVFPSKVSQTVPLYRLWSVSAGDHFYTTNNQEAENAKGLGYVREGVAGWVFPSQICGSVPLYRTYSGSGSDHFYTTNLQEKDNAVARLGYADEGVAGYVIPA